MQDEIESILSGFVVSVGKETFCARLNVGGEEFLMDIDLTELGDDDRKNIQSGLPLEIAMGAEEHDVAVRLAIEHWAPEHFARLGKLVDELMVSPAPKLTL